MKNHGPAIYFDTSSKGRNKRYNCRRTGITVRGAVPAVEQKPGKTGAVFPRSRILS
jgi:hypothetical protein